ncbi:MAG: acyl carrier protein [Solirubrobacteraceae bacterium]
MNGSEHEQIRSFILGRFPNAELADDQDIFELGYVNSLFAMELVLFVEKRFGIAIPNEELDIANFRTIAAVAELIGRCVVMV